MASSVETNPEFLIRLAQNDYMIDGAYLPDGRRLLQLAETLEALAKAVKDLTDPEARLASGG